MRRREFIAVLGAGAGWSFATGAQQVSMPVIGLLDSQSSDGWSDSLAAFRQGLNDAGYVEGRTVRIEYRSSVTAAASHKAAVLRETYSYAGAWACAQSLRAAFTSDSGNMTAAPST